MRDSVDKTISTINSELTQIREALKNPPFTDEDKEPDEILKELDRMRTRLDGFKQQIQTVQGMATINHPCPLKCPLSSPVRLLCVICHDSKDSSTFGIFVSWYHACAAGWQVLFEMEAYNFNLIAICIKEFEFKHRFWTMYREWLVKSIEWEDADFSTLDVEEVGKTITAYYKVFVILQ
jgi:hypothetical protein